MKSSYEVIALKLEFWLSVIVLIGGGALIWHNASFMPQVFMVYSAIVTFWFARRQSDSNQQAAATMLQIPQQPDPQQPKKPDPLPPQQGGPSQ